MQSPQVRDRTRTETQLSWYLVYSFYWVIVLLDETKHATILQPYGNLTTNINAIYMTLCTANSSCELESTSMFSPVQIGFLHIISIPCMLWCIFTLKDFIFHFECKITSRLSSEMPNRLEHHLFLIYFQPIKHLNCFSSKLNLLLLLFPHPFSFPLPSTISSKQLLNVLSKRKCGCWEVEMREGGWSGEAGQLQTVTRPRLTWCKERLDRSLHFSGLLFPPP